MQAKLVLGPASDPLEHEADRVAEQVMRMPGPDPSCKSAQVSRQWAPCKPKGEEKLQRKGVGTDEIIPGEVPPIVHEVLRSPGQSLDGSTRAFFEARFGHDFSQVRIHADPQAAESARSIYARAYTVGQHIVLADGGQPSGGDSQQLLAHELAHVVQQSRGGAAPELTASAPHEQEARAAAAAIAMGLPSVRVSGATRVGLARERTEVEIIQERNGAQSELEDLKAVAGDLIEQELGELRPVPRYPHPVRKNIPTDWVENGLARIGEERAERLLESIRALRRKLGQLDRELEAVRGTSIRGSVPSESHFEGPESKVGQPPVEPPAEVAPAPEIDPGGDS